MDKHDAVRLLEKLESEIRNNLDGCSAIILKSECDSLLTAVRALADKLAEVEAENQELAQVVIPRIYEEAREKYISDTLALQTERDALKAQVTELEQLFNDDSIREVRISWNWENDFWTFKLVRDDDMTRVDCDCESFSQALNEALPQLARILGAEESK